MNEDTVWTPTELLIIRQYGVVDKNMKITIVGESPQAPSGFGQQTKHLGKAFEDLGHEITYIAATASTLQEVAPKPLPNEWRIDIINQVEYLDANIFYTDPDMVIVFRDISMISAVRGLRSAYANAPFFVWLAEEGCQLSHESKKAFEVFPEGVLIPLTAATQSLVPRCGPVIPHGLPMDTYRCDTTQEELRRKWSEKLGIKLFPGEKIILNIDRNSVWKNWDLAFDFLSKAKDCRMIVHSKKGPSKFAPYDLVKLSDLYGVKGQVIFTDVSWTKGYSTEEIVELYALSDVNVSFSSGEGFGLSALEASVMGLPQIIAGYPCATETVHEAFVVPHSGVRFFGDKLWVQPDVPAMLDKLPLALSQDGRDIAQEFSETARESFDILEVANRFLDVYDIAEKDTMERRRLYRGGLFRSFEAGNLNVLATAAQKLAKSVLHVKAWDGSFVTRCLEMGLGAQGIEDEYKLEYERVKRYVRVAALNDAWPPADLVVLTDCIDYIQTIYKDHFADIMEKISNYNWIFIRNKPEFIRRGRLANRNSVGMFLESGGKVRRRDLEDMIKNTKGLESFDHEIWSNPSLDNS